MGCELAERERKERGTVVQVTGGLPAGTGVGTRRCFRLDPLEDGSHQVEGVDGCIHESIQALRGLIDPTRRKELQRRFRPSAVDQAPSDFHQALELGVTSPTVRTVSRTGDG